MITHYNGIYIGLRPVVQDSALIVRECEAALKKQRDAFVEVAELLQSAGWLAQRSAQLAMDQARGHGCLSQLQQQYSAGFGSGYAYGYGGLWGLSGLLGRWI